MDFIYLLDPIIPIFLVIGLGYFVKKANFFGEGSLNEINRFVFNFSLPVLVFLGIIKSNFEEIKSETFISILLPTILTFFLSLLTGTILGLKSGKMGTFLQASIHGNVSYVGLSVLFYAFGEESLRRGSFFVGFLILINNSIAILSLRIFGGKRDMGLIDSVLYIFKTPVIIATFAAIFFVICGIDLPPSIHRTLTILSNVALPLALIVIGASMKVESISSELILALFACLLKLFFLPFLSFILISYFQIPLYHAQPLVVLLSSPVAISSYVMAKEMNGDPKLASNSITISTLLSPISFVLWLFLVGLR